MIVYLCKSFSRYEWACGHAFPVVSAPRLGDLEGKTLNKEFARDACGARLGRGSGVRRLDGVSLTTAASFWPRTAPGVFSTAVATVATRAASCATPTGPSETSADSRGN